MICSSCRTQNHEDCKGRSHQGLSDCFCQHGVRKTKVRAKPKVIAVGEYDPPPLAPSNGHRG